MMLFLTIDHITQIENEGTNRFRKVAVEGCLHGELNSVYQHVEALEKKINQKFDLLIICGDFQSMRNQRDLEDMHCPEKYKEMGTFQEYFTGTRKAPVTTVFIGGNHEAVNSLRESHFGGWLAPNIYFLGQAGSIIVTKGKHRLRVTGCSGIYNNSDFKYCTRIERFPLRSKDRITAYHIKQVDIFRMELLARISIMKKESPENFGNEDGNFDIMLSHDWPKDIALFGQSQELYRVKPFFQKEIQAGTLGSPPMLRLLQTAKPNYWFSAHMHVKYPAIYPHPNNQFTHFLSLDKCQGQRSCLQMLTFSRNENESEKEEDNQESVKIQIDPVWIGVLLLTRDLMRGGDNLYYFDKQEIKVVDIARMNKLIQSYPELRLKIDSLGPVYLDPSMNQKDQTATFLKTIGLEVGEVEGICFEKESKVETMDVQDEIDLEL